MQKIVSEEEKKRKQKRNNLIIGIILTGLMVLSIGGYSFYDSEKTSSAKKVIYNSYELNSNGNLWILNLGDYQFGFKNNPYETNFSDISEIKKINEYYDKPLYIFSKDNEAIYEIASNFKQFVQRTQTACPEKNSECKKEFPEFPIKDCSNNFIIIEKSNSSEIKQNESCVFINFKDSEKLKIVDEFLYRAIGVK